MKNFKKFTDIVAGLADDADKFYNKGNNAAGTRVRKGMQDLKNLAQAIRKEIQDAKNKAATKKPAAAKKAAPAKKAPAKKK
jgi:hypothetical protein